MPFETCRHIKHDGAYCGSPALKTHKYCYYHLMDRGRRLRRARALRDNVPYRLEMPPLLDLASVQFALSEVTQALGSGQLDQRAAGKMLYAIQQATSVIKYRAKLEAAQETMKDMNDQAHVIGLHLPASGKCGADANSPADQPSTQFHPSRVQEYPRFEQEFGINPGSDVDIEIDWTLRKADEETELRQVNDLPAPPPGMRIGSPQYRVYREECYQGLNMRLNNMKHQLRDYYEEKRKQSEQLLKKEMLAATRTAELQRNKEEETDARIKKEPASVPAHNASVADTA